MKKKSLIVYNSEGPVIKAFRKTNSSEIELVFDGENTKKFISIEQFRQFIENGEPLCTVEKKTRFVFNDLLNEAKATPNQIEQFLSN
jgi:hypothetical protein